MAIWEYPLKTGSADYLLFVDRRAIGAVEAKAVGSTLSDLEDQSEKYSIGLASVPPADLAPSECFDGFNYALGLYFRPP